MRCAKDKTGIFKLADGVLSVSQAEVSFTVNKTVWPGRDPNAWLAGTLESRARWAGRPDFVYLAIAAPFSILSEDVAPVALALDLLCKEEPELLTAYEKDLSDTMVPIYSLMEAGDFVEAWRDTNPWTWAHYPELAAGIAAATAGMGPLRVKQPVVFH